MPNFQRQGPLDHLSLGQRAVESLGEAGVGIGEVRYEGAISLRARRDDAAARKALAATLDRPLPETTQLVTKGDQELLGLGPDEWLLLCPKAPMTAEALREALAGHFIAIADLSDNYVELFLRGPRVTDLLAKGVPIDLHESAFPPGRCAQTLMSKAEIILFREEGAKSDTYTLLCRPSFAQYVFAWLEDAAKEYGLVILEA